MNKSLIIFGTGGHARVVLETALLTNKYKKILFLDDRKKDKFLGYTILGNFDYLLKNKKNYYGFDIFVGIGDGNARIRSLEILLKNDFQVPTILHLASWVSNTAILEKGSIVLANATVQAGVSAGLGTIVNNNASIDHECNLGKGVHICPGANVAGNVIIGDKSWIGIGSRIIQNLKIGSEVVIGAGSCVIRNVIDGQVVYGVPAKESSKSK